MSILTKLKNINIFSSKAAFDAQYEVTPIPDTELSMVGCQVIVETYESGDSWYRKYSDGHIEQGGKVAVSAATTATINFIAPFINAPSNVKLMPWFGTTQGEQGSNPSLLSTATNSMSIFTGEWSGNRVGALYMSWEAKGK